MKFFIDESGNTGDAALHSWGTQPTFVLAAVGVPDDSELLETKVAALRERYNIQMPELKGSKLYKSKELFVEDLIGFLVDEGFPLYVELVDKKYHITMMLVSYFLSSAEKLLVDNNEKRDCNIFADLIYDQFDESVLKAYSIACLERTADRLYGFLHMFAVETRAHFDKVADPSKWSGTADKALWANLVDISQRAKQNTERFEERVRAGISRKEMVDEYLAPPDKNKSGDVLALLPHVTAFSNMYARINASYGKDEIVLIHDEQAEFDDVVRDYQQALSINKFAGINDIQAGEPTLWPNYVSYEFNSPSSIQFADSKEEVGVQVADVVAGFCRKYFDERLTVGEPLGEPYESIAERLWEVGCISRGQGVNPVSTMERCRATFYRN